MAVVLDLLVELASGGARAAHESGRRLPRHRRPALLTWPDDEAAGRGSVEAVRRRSRLALLAAASLLAAALLVAVIATAVGFAAIVPSAGTGVVAAAIIGSAQLGQRRTTARPTIALNLVELCQGGRCRPLHPRYPSITRVELGGEAHVRLRFSVDGRTLATVPVPPARRAEAEAYVAHFRAEFAPSA